MTDLAPTAIGFAAGLLIGATSTGGGALLTPALILLARVPPSIAIGSDVLIGFGPEGCVLIDLIGRHRLPIDLFTLDTGLFFDETYELWRGLEKRYDRSIRRVAPELTIDEQARAHGDRVWERTPDRCCAIRKVAPLDAELARVDAWITAIRRDQTPQRAAARVVEWDAIFGSRRSTPSLAGRNRTSGAISWNTTCRTIRCMIWGIRASAATRARARCGRERTLARGAGGAAPRRSAGCTARRRPRAEER